MNQDIEFELTDLNLSPVKKYGKSLPEKRFMLNLFAKYDLKWQAVSLLRRLSTTVLPFWFGSTIKVSDLSEQDIDRELAKIEPQIPSVPYIVDEIVLNEFTSPTQLEDAD